MASPSPIPPPTYLDFDRSPNTINYDSRITKRVSYRNTFNDHVINHFKSLEPHFLQLYSYHGLTLSAVREMIRGWTILFSSNVYQIEIADSFSNYLLGGKKYNTVIDQTIRAAMRSRKQRWISLATQEGIPIPDGFRVYRGIRDTLPSIPIVKSVLQAWHTKSPVAIPMKRTASFSLKEASAINFATGLAGLGKSDSNREAIPGIVFDTDVPLEFTLADKLVDGGSFLIPWWDQYEIIAGGPKENYLWSHYARIKIIFKGRVYIHTDLTDLERELLAEGMIL